MTQDIWPARTAMLAVLGGAAGLAFHNLLPPGGKTIPEGTLALCNGLGVFALGFAYVWERSRPGLAIAFALAVGFIAWGTSHFAGGTAGLDDIATWRMVCAAIAIAIAAPLFQAWRDGAGAEPGNGPRIPYPIAHDRAWTNLVLWFASLAFLGISWLLAWLLAGLFDLIGIKILKTLLDARWFGFVFSGATLLGGTGLLRDQIRILSTLQRVLRFVLSALTPVLALGLALFLVALPFTGLAPLWAATRSTTPILLACIIGALVLANAIISDEPADEGRSRVMRLSAAVLGITMLPLGVIAALSTARRIMQHGLSPDRLWAVTFVAIACAYGLVYAIAVLRRSGWMARIRQGNLAMAVLLCAAALLLATPIIDFGALSTRSQLARLESGRISPEKFDWAALRFDFGAAGRQAVAALAKSASPAIASAALEAQKADNRWVLRRPDQLLNGTAELKANLRVLPAGTQIPPALLAAMARSGDCAGKQACVLLIEGERAILFLNLQYAPFQVIWQRGAGKEEWQQAERGFTATTPGAQAADRQEVLEGEVTIRTVRRRQIAIDGKPVDVIFE
ncbi:DUF4153 domain-containing protein [Sandarakinorhabdus sp.]|uniref:DUF4153 domain-containing protein n=1 Tax=Sandarakinorhabdus sp. TaxID=1916663 RepID=UPI00286E4010|nr:DUF4153 domain-containing protein [Sandarakinorhabdus sp.]